MNYIKGATLSFPQVWNQLQFKRTPSRAYPNSYAVACLTQKGVAK